MVVAQYYNFIRLGKEGYRNIMSNCLENARYLASKLAKSDKFKMINEAQFLPIVALRLKDEGNYTVFNLSDKLRERGWIISAYTMPANAQNIAVMRVVVREHFSKDMADILFQDIMNACEHFEKAEKGIKKSVDNKEKKHPIC